MKVLAAAGVVLAVVAACAAPAPTAPTPSAADPTIKPTSSAPSPETTDLVVSGTGATVRFDDWTARCGAVQGDDCEGVARLFVNNLARSWKGVLDASGGRIVVEPRPTCPIRLPEWAERATCWQATAAAPTGNVCMVIARRANRDGTVSPFGQVGGDEMTGRAGGPPVGWPVCD